MSENHLNSRMKTCINSVTKKALYSKNNFHELTNFS